MDLVELEKLRQVLSLQGVRAGKHEWAIMDNYDLDERIYKDILQF